MVEYIKQTIKNYIGLYLLNKKYQKITKKDIDEQENKVYKLSTLKGFYNSEEFDSKVDQEQVTLREMKNLIAVAYISKIETKNNLGYRGFSTNDLLQYRKEFYNSFVIEYNDLQENNSKIKTIK
ncbi:MAG: hypothetical protein ACI4OT_04150 [Bacilli bacterium]